ncbi:MAG: hypothetical protein OXB96_03225 [Candidatus Kaiserbacteria bacterium]|nr:hypothetical protein [Candidatus Kaiserbacteria bacterium]
MKVKYTLMMIMMMAMAVIISCSPDRVEEPEEILLPEIAEEPEPEYSWSDGVVTITTGNYKTSEELVKAINRRKPWMEVNWGIEVRLPKSGFPMSRQKKSVDVTVVTLLEAGFTELVTLPEIIERYRQLGYRPLTLEESFELRMQFEDQPNCTEEPENKWGTFYTLLSEKEADMMGGTMLTVSHSSPWSRMIPDYRIGFTRNGTLKEQPFFDPYAKERTDDSWFIGDKLDENTGSRFACAIIK